MEFGRQDGRSSVAEPSPAPRSSNHEDGLFEEVPWEGEQIAVEADAWLAAEARSIERALWSRYHADERD